MAGSGGFSGTASLFRLKARLKAAAVIRATRHLTEAAMIGPLLGYA
jgi:hypothetical protein